MAMSIQMARIAGSLGVPPAIIGKMVETQGRSVAWLTPEDLTLMGVKVYTGDILAATRTPGAAAPPFATGTAARIPPVTTAPAPPSSLPAAPSTVPAGASVSFIAGRNDRMSWDAWLKGQPTAFREGAVVAQLQAGLVIAGSCRGPNGSDRGDFTRGCDTARERLTPAEVRMRNDAEYAAGWNSLGVPPLSGQAQEAEYRGAYFCGRQVAALSVRLFPLSSDRNRRAVFSFGPQPTSPDVPRGAFIAEGAVDASAGQLVLQPVKWLTRPNAYPWFGLSGTSRDGGATFSGRVTDAGGCSQFTLKREPAGR
jgi:hypothetical protein